MIHLVDIDPGNWRLKLEVAESQKQYQGRRYGSAATKLILDAMKQDGKYSKVDLCYIEGNDAAKKLYESFGFVETDRDEDEIIMELDLAK